MTEVLWQIELFWDWDSESMLPNKEDNSKRFSSSNAASRCISSLSSSSHSCSSSGKVKPTAELSGETAFTLSEDGVVLVDLCDIGTGVALDLAFGFLLYGFATTLVLRRGGGVAFLGSGLLAVVFFLVGAFLRCSALRDFDGDRANFDPGLGGGGSAYRVSRVTRGNWPILWRN